MGTYEGSGSGGDVKLFDSIINMQSSSGNQDGDLAVVYTSTQANITEDTEFQIATFPETVTLTSAISNHIEVGFVPVESTGGMFECYGSLDNERFSIDVYGDSGNIRIEYTSQDGLTYTRTRFEKDNVTIEGNEIDFGVIIKFGSPWGEAQWDDRIGQFIIAGSTNFSGLFQYEDNSFNYAKTQFGFDSESIYKSSFYGSNGVVVGTLQNNSNLSKSELLKRAEVYDVLSELTLNSDVNTSELFYRKPYKYVPNFDTSNYNDMSRMFFVCSNLITVPNYNTSNVLSMNCMFDSCSNLITVPNFDMSKVLDVFKMFDSCSNLVTVPNFNVSNVYIMSNMFYGCTNLTTVPEFNTSNVAIMSNMFQYCTNLTTVPEFNTSNLSNISGMFMYCNNLSDASIQNIINMYINSNVSNSLMKSLQNTATFGPFYFTNISNTRYQNRWAELDAAGWSY